MNLTENNKQIVLSALRNNLIDTEIVHDLREIENAVKYAVSIGAPDWAEEVINDEGLPMKFKDLVNQKNALDVLDVLYHLNHHENECSFNLDKYEGGWQDFRLEVSSVFMDTDILLEIEFDYLRYTEETGTFVETEIKGATLTINGKIMGWKLDCGWVEQFVNDYIESKS